jgi:hypothetical protein
MLDECAHLGIQVRRIIVGNGENWGAMGKEEGWDVVGVAGKGGEAFLPRGTSDWQRWTRGGGHGLDDVISLSLSMSSSLYVIRQE